MGFVLWQQTSKARTHPVKMVSTIAKLTQISKQRLGTVIGLVKEDMVCIKSNARNGAVSVILVSGARHCGTLL